MSRRKRSALWRECASWGWLWSQPEMIGHPVATPSDVAIFEVARMAEFRAIAHAETIDQAWRYKRVSPSPERACHSHSTKERKTW